VKEVSLSSWAKPSTVWGHLDNVESIPIPPNTIYTIIPEISETQNPHQQSGQQCQAGLGGQLAYGHGRLYREEYYRMDYLI
jgi:hypothetical protein